MTEESALYQRNACPSNSKDLFRLVATSSNDKVIPQKSHFLNPKWLSKVLIVVL